VNREPWTWVRPLGGAAIVAVLVWHLGVGPVVSAVRAAWSEWTFGVTGVRDSQGVATGVAYGVMVLVASLPGAGLLVATRQRRHTAGSGRADLVRPRSPGAPRAEGEAHG
jgi:hypothetical protein